MILTKQVLNFASILEHFEFHPSVFDSIWSAPFLNNKKKYSENFKCLLSLNLSHEDAVSCDCLKTWNFHNIG